jgi:hypothetical protein
MRKTVVVVEVKQLTDGTYQAEQPAPCPECGAVPMVIELDLFDRASASVVREPTTTAPEA